MNKKMFLHQLKIRLSQLPDEEINRRLDYYSEMIDDMVEDGMTEEEAVKSFGDINTIANQIMQDAPFKTLLKSRIRPEKGWTTAAIIITILCSPIWVPVVLSILAAVAGIYLSIWVIALVALVLAITLGIAGIAILIKGFTLISFGAGSLLFTLGIGLLFLGFCAFALLLVKYGTMGLLHLTKWIFIKIKSLFIKKEVK